MSDRISTYRYIPAGLVDRRTVGLMGCEGCAFVWNEDEVDGIDNAVIACPSCGSTRHTEPLYDACCESTNRHWPSDKPQPNSMGNFSERERRGAGL